MVIDAYRWNPVRLFSKIRIDQYHYVYLYFSLHNASAVLLLTTDGTLILADTRKAFGTDLCPIFQLTLLI